MASLSKWSSRILVVNRVNSHWCTCECWFNAQTRQPMDRRTLSSSWDLGIKEIDLDSFLQGFVPPSLQLQQHQVIEESTLTLQPDKLISYDNFKPQFLLIVKSIYETNIIQRLLEDWRMIFEHCTVICMLSNPPKKESGRWGCRICDWFENNDHFSSHLNACGYGKLASFQRVCPPRWENIFFFVLRIFYCF